MLAARIPFPHLPAILVHLLADIAVSIAGRRRAVFRGLAIVAVPGVLVCCGMEDRASGPFKLRPGRKIELRAATSGFIRAVVADEGDHVSPGQVVIRLEVPDLETRVAQKRAEADRIRADTRLVEVGSRPEEVAEQRSKVERAVLWRDRARADLDRAQGAHRHDLEAARQQVVRGRAEAFAARSAAQQTHALHVRGFVSMTEEVQSRKGLEIAETTLRQSEANLRAAEIQGTLPAETELARREKDLADARAVLSLLAAGSRREELESARARLVQVEEELGYLMGLERSLRLMPAESGVITTARLREKVGQYVHEGDLIAEVRGENLEAEILLDEQSAGRIRPGQAVELRARAATFETFTAMVDRVAPTAAKAEGETRTTVTVCCRLDAASEDLKPEMTGHARIARGRRAIGAILAERVLGFLRTEFWF